jgi:hypothetical protein
VKVILIDAKRTAQGYEEKFTSNLDKEKEMFVKELIEL